jgi:alkylated DNA repair dioxygenase AlkB
MAKQFSLLERIGDEHAPDRKCPEGFRYQPALISRADEDALVGRVCELPFREFEFHGYLGKRRVVSFGWQYDFAGRSLKEAKEIPEFLLTLRAQAASFANMEPGALQQVLVTEYRPGAGVGWHRDKAVFGQVIGVSLLAPCVLRFRKKVENPRDAEKPSRQWQRVNAALQPRSAYLLSGPARMDWHHSIRPMEALRYSITFRNVREDGAR